LLGIEIVDRRVVEADVVLVIRIVGRGMEVVRVVEGPLIVYVAEEVYDRGEVEVGMDVLVLFWSFVVLLLRWVGLERNRFAPVGCQLDDLLLGTSLGSGCLGGK
jgi:hypothetical protein